MRKKKERAEPRLKSRVIGVSTPTMHATPERTSLSSQDWAGWCDLAPEDFWFRVYDIEEGDIGGDHAFAGKLAAYRLRNREHFQSVKEAYANRRDGDPDFAQAMVRGRLQQMQAHLTAGVAPALLAPIHGIDATAYGIITARRSKLLPNDATGHARICGEFGLSVVQFGEVDRGWKLRLNDPSQSNQAANVLSTKYAEGFLIAALRAS